MPSQFHLLPFSMLWPDCFVLFLSFKPHIFTSQLLLICSFHPDPGLPFLFLSSCQILLPHILLKCKISNTLLCEDFSCNLKQNQSPTSVLQYTLRLPISLYLLISVFSQRVPGPEDWNISSLIFLNPSGKRKCSGLLIQVTNVFLGVTGHQALRASPTFFLFNPNNTPLWFPEGRDLVYSL